MGTIINKAMVAEVLQKVVHQIEETDETLELKEGENVRFDMSTDEDGYNHLAIDLTFK